MKVSVSSSTSQEPRLSGGQSGYWPAGVLAAVSFCLVSDASAEGLHRRRAPRVRPGVANTFVKHDKMDTDVARRANGLLRLGTADVIVTLEAGVDLPASFNATLTTAS